MRLYVQSLIERLRTSLFVVPMVGVVLGVLVGQAALALDEQIDGNGSELPLRLASTVDSARALLSTIAGATITFAGIAFSISLLTIQLASSQYSPRVVHTLFRDPFNGRVMALVVGTFTYCIVVLRVVRSPLEDGGDPLVPNISVALATVLGIATILAIVAFINHSAHAMDVSEILEDVRRGAVEQIRREWPEAADQPADETDLELPKGPGHAVHFDRTGWVQALDHHEILAAIPEGTTFVLDTFPGRYAIRGTPLGTLVPAPPDAGSADPLTAGALAIGDTRTMQQDVSYGLRQLADVALKALSPGINDPTTAQDAIFHSAAVLAELLRRDPPPQVVEGDAGRRLLLPQQPTHDELVVLAYAEVRRAAAPHPTVCVYLLESLDLLAGLAATRNPLRVAVLEEQARLTLAGCEAADVLPADLQIVQAAYHHRFGEAGLQR